MKSMQLFVSLVAPAKSHEEPPATPPTPPATPPSNPPSTPPKPEGKVWTDDYVSSLREEAKSHRLQKKQYETHLRSVLGLEAETEITDAHVTAFQQNQQKALSETMAKANARLVAAEIKTLDGYNAKLVDKLLDRSKITIEEDGTVKGLKEAVEELEKEFPEIRATGGGNGGGANPQHQGSKPEIEQLEEEYAKATTQAQRVMLKNKIFALQQKQK